MEKTNMIETENLILRAPKIEDFEEYLGMNLDPVAKQYTGGVTTRTYEEELEDFQIRCRTFDSEEKKILSVIQKETGKYIGYCGFKYDDRLRGFEILYGFVQSAWGKGFGYEAAKAALPYGFHEMNLEEIFATVNPKNTASERILQKTRMNYIGDIENWGSQGKMHKYRILREDKR